MTSERSAPATTRSRAARSTRCCGKVTPTGAPRRPSRSTPASTLTRWASGRANRARTSPRMSEGDFRSTEKSVTLSRQCEVRIEHVAADGTVTELKGPIALQAGEIIDAAIMQRAALDRFLAEQLKDAKAPGRPVLGSPQGDDDAGLGPDHLRPRGQGVLPGPRRPGLEPQRRLGAHYRQVPRSPTETTAQRWPWSTPTGGSPTSTSPPT